MSGKAGKERRGKTMICGNDYPVSRTSPLFLQQTQKRKDIRKSCSGIEREFKVLGGKRMYLSRNPHIFYILPVVYNNTAAYSAVLATTVASYVCK